MGALISYSYDAAGQFVGRTDEIVAQDVLSATVIDEAEFDWKWQQAVDSHGS